MPSDPFGEQIGGIKSFVRGFVRSAPEDFAPEFVACTSDPVSRPIGRWQTLEMEGRPVRYLPVLSTPNPHRRPLIPLSLKFTVSAMVRRNAHHFHGRVLQFNHPGTPAGFLGVDAPKILVVHLNAADIDRGLGESRWTRVPGLLHRFEDVTLPRMDRIFLVNEAGLSFYRQRHPKVGERLAFLPTSVDQSTFHRLDRAEVQAARRDLAESMGVSLDTSTRWLLFVGRLERQKDPHLLIESFAAILRLRPDVRLIVVGEGALRQEATDHARVLNVADRVHWLGYRDRAEMPRLMNVADALILPSAFEGMPIVVLEALACGLPVVATAVGEVPRLIRDRKNGRLVHSRDPDQLAEAADWVLERPREHFYDAAAAAVAPYHPEQVMLPFYEAHRELHMARWMRNR
jgi:glycosyltransferase involved in cell wall biosynthesis